MDLRERLESIRDRLTDEMTSAEGSALASVAKQLRETLAEIEALPVLEGSTVDDLTKRRADRRSAVVPDKTRRGNKRGA